MTIRILGFVITIEKMVQAPKFVINETERAEDVKAILDSEFFATLKLAKAGNK